MIESKTELAENIIHLVLARTPTAPKGIKGIKGIFGPGSSMQGIVEFIQTEMA
mgnify:CR=1 FL=1